MSENHQPPVLAQRFLRWFCQANLLEVIEGDLEELFHQRIKEKGVKVAKWGYYKDVFSLFRPFSWRKISFPDLIKQRNMWRNHFKIAWRNLFSQGMISFINILGLTTSICVCLFLLKYVEFEKSYDKWHKQSANLVRVRLDRIYEGKHDKSAGITPFVGPQLKQEFPEVIDYTKLWSLPGNTSIHYKDLAFIQDKVFYADSSFFSLFSYPLSKGDPAKVLADLNTAVLSATTAQKFFGQEDPIGKTIQVNNQGNQQAFVITGIAADIPENTHLKFNLLLSFKTLIQATNGSAHDNRNGWNAFMTYLLLQPGTSITALENKLEGFVDRNYSRLLDNGIGVKLLLQSLESIHLNSNLRFEAAPNGNAKLVSVLSLIALLILAIAWFNYINLSTARAMERAKEVSVRKVSGARKSDLVRQFLTEVLLVNGISVLLGLFLLTLLNPLFNVLVGKNIPLYFGSSLSNVLQLSGLLFIGAILSGIYPAMVMSSFSPIKVFKKEWQQVKGLNIRKVLVVLQFSAAVVLIAGTLIIIRQIQYVRHQDLGVDLEQVLVLRGPGAIDSTFADRLNTFRETVTGEAAVSRMSNSSNIPGQEISWVNNSIRWAKKGEQDVNSIPFLGIGPDFFQTYQLSIIAGRVFSTDLETDRNKIILTTAASKQLGFSNPEEAIGQQVLDGTTPMEVVGVSRDFNQQALNNAYLPVIFQYHPEASSFFALKLNTKDLSQSITSIEAHWKAQFPGNPFDYFFLDEFFNRQYLADQQFGRIFGLFSLLAILIAILGLFGLSAQLIARRTKEIGIRKILGASVPKLFILLSKNYLQMVLIAIILASPTIYFLADWWLSSYAFRIEVSWWMFVIPGLMVIGMALLIVGYRSVRAALANPVEALRYE